MLLNERGIIALLKNLIMSVMSRRELCTFLHDPYIRECDSEIMLLCEKNDDIIKPGAHIL